MTVPKKTRRRLSVTKLKKQMVAGPQAKADKSNVVRIERGSEARRIIPGFRCAQACLPITDYFANNPLSTRSRCASK
jgi:hypothetical protein